MIRTTSGEIPFPAGRKLKDHRYRRCRHVYRIDTGSADLLRTRRRQVNPFIGRTARFVHHEPDYDCPTTRSGVAEISLHGEWHHGRYSRKGSGGADSDESESLPDLGEGLQIPFPGRISSPRMHWRDRKCVHFLSRQYASMNSVFIKEQV